MKIAVNYLKKILVAFFLCIIFFVCHVVTPTTDVKNLMYAICVLVINVHILFRNKNNMQMFLVAIILLYFNYSAIINYYIFEESSVLSFSQCNTTELKEIAIVCLLLFMIILDFGVKWEQIPILRLKMSADRKKVAYYAICFVLVFVWCICLNRGSLGTSYRVFNISYFEYAYILFILALYFARGNKLQEIFLTVMLILYVLQDVYYGGRISSLEFILVFYIMLYYKFFTKKRIMIAIMSAVTLFSIVSVYRLTYSFNQVNLETVLSFVVDGRFSLDSASNAFYSTLCAISGKQKFLLAARMENFFGFIVDIFSGITVGEYIILPEFLRLNGLYNIGGCWAIGYLYYWFGYIGVVIFSIAVVVIINKLATDTAKAYNKLFLMVVLVTIPRWYIYTPAALFRGIFLFYVAYIFIKMFVFIKARKG